MRSQLGSRARRPLIVGNWKMNLGTIEEALSFVRRLRPALSAVRRVDVVLCPPFPVIPVLSDVLRNSPIRLGAQTMHWAEDGAHTGEVSPTMLRGLCDYVILGHSERRASAGPSAADESVNRKVRAALAHGIIPIVCVGESAAQRDRGATEAFVGGQVEAALAGLRPEDAARCVLAYEPVWAIGSGRPATPADANRTIGLTIRGTLATGFDETVAARVRVLYGGSVTATNICEFTSMPEVDGALVGGASVDPGFADLARNAALPADTAS